MCPSFNRINPLNPETHSQFSNIHVCEDETDLSLYCQYLRLASNTLTSNANKEPRSSGNAMTGSSSTSHGSLTAQVVWWPFEHGFTHWLCILNFDKMAWTCIDWRMHTSIQRRVTTCYNLHEQIWEATSSYGLDVLAFKMPTNSTGPKPKKVTTLLPGTQGSGSGAEPSELKPPVLVLVPAWFHHYVIKIHALIYHVCLFYELKRDSTYYDQKDSIIRRVGFK